MATKNPTIKILNIKNQDYELIPKQATADEFGGVKADARDTSIDTQAVNIGSDGKLYTKASGTGPRGPQGYGVGSISYKSGSTAAGGTATYSVKQETTNKEIGTFTITNGANGKDGANGSNGDQGPRGFDVKTIVANGQDSAGGNIYKIKDSNGSFLENTFTAPRGPKGDNSTVPGPRGASFNYNWSGTSLGVKNSDESVYNYVNLKGDKGDQGVPNEKLTEKDTRNTNENPQWYFTTYGCSIVTEFKYCNKIGVQNILSGTYCNMTTVIAWHDPSGGYPFQIAFNNSSAAKICFRRATSKTEWGPWEAIAQKGDTGAAAGITTPTVDNTTANNVGTAAVEVTASGPNTAKVFNFKFKNLKGESGKEGPRGPRGYDVKTIVASGQDSAGGNIYKMKDSSGALLDNTFTAPKGQKGDQGAKITGISTSTISQSGGYTITPVTFSLNDGSSVGPINIKAKDGENGQDGQDGVDGTPCTHSWTGTTLTVTSASGTSSANLKGDTGAKITSATAGTSTQSSGYTITPVTFNLNDGTSVKNVNIKAKDGKDGENGKDGKDGSVKALSTSGTGNVITGLSLDTSTSTLSCTKGSFYTSSTIDNKLNGKSNTGHSHTVSGNVTTDGASDYHSVALGSHTHSVNVKGDSKKTAATTSVCYIVSAIDTTLTLGSINVASAEHTHSIDLTATASATPAAQCVNAATSDHTHTASFTATTTN